MIVMGVVNVTPDSFSDGGEYFSHAKAVAHGIELFAQGAQMVDVGGESTRPFADTVSEDEELRRVVPVVRVLSQYGFVSVDTRHEKVAEKSVENGAKLINDISGTLAPVAARCNVPWVAMHMKGNPKTMQLSPTYEDVVEEVLNFLRLKIEEALSMGVPKVIVDPGIGFGKTALHNLQLLKSIGRFRELGCAVLVGTSRKGFLSKLSVADKTPPPPKDREDHQLAVEAWCALNEVSIVRVHDVKKTVLLLELHDKAELAYREQEAKRKQRKFNQPSPS